MPDGMIILYGLFIYGFIVVTRTKLEPKLEIIISIVIANLIHLDPMSNAANIFKILLYEVIVFATTIPILKVTFTLSKINLGKILYIIEIAAAVILTLIYYFVGNFIFA